MKHLSLLVSLRNEFGRCAMKRLRANGRIPAVIYGSSETSSLSIDEKAFQSLLQAKGNSAALINVKIDGASNGKRDFLADIADIQQDPITDKFLHVDFHEVVQSEKMVTTVPLEFFGESIGVKNNGGVLNIARYEINVRCFPSDLPGSIRIDVSGLDIGNIIHLGAIVVPDGVEVLGDPITPVISCNTVTDITEETSSTTETSATSANEDAVVKA